MVITVDGIRITAMYDQGYGMADKSALTTSISRAFSRGFT